MSRLLAPGRLDGALAPDAFLQEVADSTAEAEAGEELARLRREPPRPPAGT